MSATGAHDWHMRRDDSGGGTLGPALGGTVGSAHDGHIRCTRRPAWETSERGPEAVLRVAVAHLLEDLQALQPAVWAEWVAGRAVAFRPVRRAWASPGLPPAVLTADTTLHDRRGWILLRWCLGGADGEAQLPIAAVPDPARGLRWYTRCPLTLAATQALFIRAGAGPGCRAAHGLEPAA